MNDRNKDYVFVSYSHKDDIGELLSAFEQRGYNLVYDRAMSYGEEWDLNARRYIQNAKCKGVLSVLSTHSLCSKPVLMETEYAQRFRKPTFALLTEHRTLPTLYETLAPTLDENTLYILDCMMENFPPEQLYAFADSPDWELVEQTFAKWDFHPDIRANYDSVPDVAYSSDIRGEKERLQRQQESYYELDMQAIDTALEGKENATVLDIGCGNGQVTLSRFADDPRVGKVIGVDVHAASIAAAQQQAAAYGDKFTFAVVDLNADSVVEDIRAVMATCGVKTVDLVFAALVLHHLKNPHLLLLKLYDIFDERGRIVVRGSDDGGKLCYPESELLTEILARYDKLVRASDRENGRKLYHQLYHAGYVNPRIKYDIFDTAGQTREAKELLFHLAFDFRINRVDALLEKDPDNAFLAAERAWLANALERLREAFFKQDFWYCVTTYIAIAEVSE